MFANIVLVQLNVRGLDDELPAARHGIAGVDGEVHHHLFDLAGIGFDASQPRGERGVQANVLPEKTSQQFVHVADHAIEVEYLGRHHLLAAEGEQLAGQGRGAVSRLLDLVELRP